MDEDVSVAAGAGARFVEQTRPAGFEAGDGGVEVPHAPGDVVQSRPALFGEPGNRRIPGGGDGGMGGCGGVGCSSSMRESPAGSMATSTFSAATVSRWATARPSDS